MNLIEKFLLKHGQSPETVDIEKMFGLVLKEIEEGLDSGSSMPMVPTFLSESIKTEKKSKKLLIDAGGTNFRSAIGFFDDKGNAVISDLSVSKMPGTCGRIGKDEFYGKIAGNVRHLLSQTNDVGFCFSYNVSMGADLDGVVSAISKEVDAPEVVGTKVGQCTLSAFQKLDGKKRRIAILNDTVATLLGGKAKTQEGEQYSGYIGFIYGTGSNVCYSEKTANIKKLKNAESFGQSMIVNMECGGFDKFPRGDFDKAAIEKTANPQKQIFEKMTSGLYLGEVIFEAFSAFQRENGFVGKVNLCPFSLKDVSEFLNGGSEALFLKFFENQTDIDAAKLLCSKLIERSGKMWAIFLSAVASRIDTASGLPVAVVAEGTTFHKLSGFKESLQKYLDSILSQRGVSCKIVDGTDLNMLGALAAATALSLD